MVVAARRARCETMKMSMVTRRQPVSMSREGSSSRRRVNSSKVASKEGLCTEERPCAPGIRHGIKTLSTVYQRGLSSYETQRSLRSMIR